MRPYTRGPSGTPAMACSWLPLISSSLDASMSGLAEQTLPWRSTMLTGTKRSSSKSEVHRPHKRKLNAQAGVIRCQDAGKISAETRDAALPQQLAEGFARVGLGPASQGKQIDARGRRVYDAGVARRRVDLKFEQLLVAPHERALHVYNLPVATSSMLEPSDGMRSDNLSLSS